MSKFQSSIKVDVDPRIRPGIPAPIGEAAILDKGQTSDIFKKVGVRHFEWELVISDYPSSIGEDDGIDIIRSIELTGNPNSNLLTSGSGVIEDRVRQKVFEIDSSLDRAKHIFVNGDYAYISMHQGLGGFIIFDISDLENIEQLSSSASVSSVNKTCTNPEGTRLYTFLNGSGGPAGFEIWNIENKENPVKVSTTTTGGQSFNGDINGGYVYGANTNALGLQIWNIQDETSPVLVDELQDNAGDAKVVGDVLYFTRFDQSRIYAYDISDRENPALISSLVVGTFIVPINIENGTLAFVEEFNGSDVYVIDITDPANMTLLSTMTITESDGNLINQGSVMVKDNFCYIQTQTVLTIFDITDPSNPEVVTRYKLSDGSLDYQGVQNSNAIIDNHILLTKRNPNSLVVVKDPLFFNKDVEVTNLKVTKSLIIENFSENIPSSSNSEGVKGQMIWDDDYLYICTDTDTWKRIALTSF